MISKLLTLWLSLRPGGTEPEAYESVLNMIVEMIKLEASRPDETDISVQGREVGPDLITLPEPTTAAWNNSGVSTGSSVQEVESQTTEWTD